MNPILEHIDIKTLIMLLGLDMKEHSSYFLGKCCFHDDDKPSFSISKKGFYSCFACGEKGSINSLVYKLKGIGIYKFLNIQDVNSFIFTHPKKEEKLRESFPKLDQFIVKGNLKSPYDSELIMNYLKSRKVSNEFIDYFDIKYTNYAEINNIKFIDRIIIPSFENGELIGYEGRDYTKKQSPKVLYAKGSDVSTLFNIDNLDYNKELIICEGQWHIPQIWTHITKNVTHTYGVMISNKQKELINKFKKVIYFADNDEAGINGISEFDNFCEGEYYITMSDVKGEDPGDMTLDRIKEALNNKILSINYFLNKSKLFENEGIKW